MRENEGNFSQYRKTSFILFSSTLNIKNYNLTYKFKANINVLVLK